MVSISGKVRGSFLSSVEELHAPLDEPLVPREEKLSYFPVRNVPPFTIRSHNPVLSLALGSTDELFRGHFVGVDLRGLEEGSASWVGRYGWIWGRGSYRRSDRDASLDL